MQIEVRVSTEIIEFKSMIQKLVEKLRKII